MSSAASDNFSYLPNLISSFDLTAVCKALQALAKITQPEELLRQSSQLILQQSGCDRCAVLLPNGEGCWYIRAIATVETTELGAERLDDTVNFPVKLIQYVTNTGEAVVCNDLALDLDLPITDAYLTQHQPRSLLCVPICLGGLDSSGNPGNPLSAIVYGDSQSNTGGLTRDRIFLLNLLCTQIAILLENAQRYQAAQAYTHQLERSLQQLQSTQTKLVADEKMMQEQALALVQLSESKAITQGDLNVAFQELTTVTAHILHVERVSIWLFDDQYTKIDCVDLFLQTGQQHLGGFELKVVDYPAYFAAMMSQPILPIDDAWTDPCTHEFVNGYLDVYNIASMLDSSVQLNGKVSGVICCEQVGEKRIWNQAEQNFIRSVANLIALALESHQRRHKEHKLKQALSELSQSQLQLVQNEKMASLGNLVAGVAHEINNPIGFLNGSTQNAEDYVHDLLEHLALYQQHYPEAADPIQAHADEIDLDFVIEDLPKLINSMQGATDRIQSISTSLRTFSRADTEYKVSANLHEGLDSTLLILKYRLKANEYRPAIAVVKHYDDQLPPIDCFPGQLNQVFMNILANAIDVLDEVAQQSSFAELTTKPQIITIQTTLLTQINSVEIRIHDNGMGMTDSVKAKIFNHLFTTKEVGRGTGLGLAIAHQIITETHGGSLEVQSTWGQGSEFRIQLPIAA